MTENVFASTPEKNPDDIILTINRTAAQYLLETSKWGTFLAVMGFILCGLMVVLAFFMSSVMSAITQNQMGGNFPRGFGFLFGIFYCLIGLLYSFPSWYLLKYSQKLKSALSSKDSSELVSAFENQKSVYKFWGIFSIVIISFYGLILLFAVLIGSLR